MIQFAPFPQAQELPTVLRADHPPPPPAPYNQPFPPAQAVPIIEAQPPPPPAHQTGVFDGTDAPFPPAPPLVHPDPHARFVAVVAVDAFELRNSVFPLDC